MKRTIVSELASAIQARENCAKSGNDEWLAKHWDRAEQLVKDWMPSGSGIDNGTTLDPDSTPDRLVFNTSYHHMDEGGGYAGWTEHQVIVTPSLSSGFELRITGKDRNQIKDYLYDVFDAALRQMIVWDNAAHKCNGGYVLA